MLTCHQFRTIKYFFFLLSIYFLSYFQSVSCGPLPQICTQSCSPADDKSNEAVPQYPGYFITGNSEINAPLQTFPLLQSIAESNEYSENPYQAYILNQKLPVQTFEEGVEVFNNRKLDFEENASNQKLRELRNVNDGENFAEDVDFVAEEEEDDENYSYVTVTSTDKIYFVGNTEDNDAGSNETTSILEENTKDSQETDKIASSEEVSTTTTQSTTEDSPLEDELDTRMFKDDNKNGTKKNETNSRNMYDEIIAMDQMDLDNNKNDLSEYIDPPDQEKINKTDSVPKNHAKISEELAASLYKVPNFQRIPSPEDFLKPMLGHNNFPAPQNKFGMKKKSKQDLSDQRDVIQQTPPRIDIVTIVIDEPYDPSKDVDPKYTKQKRNQTKIETQNFSTRRQQQQHLSNERDVIQQTPPSIDIVTIVIDEPYDPSKDLDPKHKNQERNQTQIDSQNSPTKRKTQQHQSDERNVIQQTPPSIDIVTIVIDEPYDPSKDLDPKHKKQERNQTQIDSQNSPTKRKTQQHRSDERDVIQQTPPSIDIVTIVIDEPYDPSKDLDPKHKKQERNQTKIDSQNSPTKRKTQQHLSDERDVIKQTPPSFDIVTIVIDEPYDPSEDLDPKHTKQEGNQPKIETQKFSTTVNSQQQLSDERDVITQTPPSIDIFTVDVEEPYDPSKDLDPNHFKQERNQTKVDPQKFSTSSKPEQHLSDERDVIQQTPASIDIVTIVIEEPYDPSKDLDPKHIKRRNISDSTSINAINVDPEDEIAPRMLSKCNQPKENLRPVSSSEEVITDPDEFFQEERRTETKTYPPVPIPHIIKRRTTMRTTIPPNDKGRSTKTARSNDLLKKDSTDTDLTPVSSTLTSTLESIFNEKSTQYFALSENLSNDWGGPGLGEEIWIPRSSTLKKTNSTETSPSSQKIYLTSTARINELGSTLPETSAMSTIVTTAQTITILDEETAKLSEGTELVALSENTSSTEESITSDENTPVMTVLGLDLNLIDSSNPLINTSMESTLTAETTQTTTSQPSNESSVTTTIMAVSGGNLDLLNSNNSFPNTTTIKQTISPERKTQITTLQPSAESSETTTTANVSEVDLQDSLTNSTTEIIKTTTSKSSTETVETTPIVTVSAMELDHTEEATSQSLTNSGENISAVSVSGVDLDLTVSNNSLSNTTVTTETILTIGINQTSTLKPSNETSQTTPITSVSGMGMDYSGSDNLLPQSSTNIGENTSALSVSVVDLAVSVSNNSLSNTTITTETILTTGINQTSSILKPSNETSQTTPITSVSGMGVDFSDDDNLLYDTETRTQTKSVTETTQFTPSQCPSESSGTTTLVVTATGVGLDLLGSSNSLPNNTTVTQTISTNEVSQGTSLQLTSEISGSTPLVTVLADDLNESHSENSVPSTKFTKLSTESSETTPVESIWGIDADIYDFLLQTTPTETPSTTKIARNVKNNLISKTTTTKPKTLKNVYVNRFPEELWIPKSTTRKQATRTTHKTPRWNEKSKTTTEAPTISVPSTSSKSRIQLLPTHMHAPHHGRKLFVIFALWRPLNRYSTEKLLAFVFSDSTPLYIFEYRNDPYFISKLIKKIPRRPSREHLRNILCKNIHLLTATGSRFDCQRHRSENGKVINEIEMLFTRSFVVYESGRRSEADSEMQLLEKIQNILGSL